MFSTPRRRTVGWILLALVSSLLVLAAVTSMVTSVLLTNEVRKTQLEGTPTGKRLLTASDRILDCTEPDGVCFQDSQKRTAKAVGDINRVIVLAAACSVGLSEHLSTREREVRIQACVIDGLAAQVP